jgi:maleate cis-trans isomerase
VTSAEIDYGERLRLGVVVPSGNTIAEPQLARMLPAGVAPFFTRLPLRGSSERELLGMVDGLSDAVGLLTDARVDLLVFHCTAVSTYSRSLEATIAEKMRTGSGTPTMTTADSLLAAFRALGADNLVLLSPYLPAPHQREIDFVISHGLTVLDDAALGIDTNADMAALTPEELFDFVVKHRHPAADAYFLSCTALRSAEIIEALEGELGRPVVTSNQAMAWFALRRGGIADPVPGFGTLLRLPEAPPP